MDPLYWSILLLAGGFLVIFLEVFVPSAGILGLVAGILLVSGVIVGFIDSVQTGMIGLMSTLVMLPVMFSLMIKIWPHTPIGRRILIGPVAQEDVELTGDYYDEIKSLQGRLGIAKTKMLPSGIVVVDGKKFDAVTDGLPIEADETIKVISAKGNRIVVARYEGESSDPDDLPATAGSDLLSKPLEELGLDAIDE